MSILLHSLKLDGRHSLRTFARFDLKALILSSRNTSGPSSPDLQGLVLSICASMSISAINPSEFYRGIDNTMQAAPKL